MNVMLNIYDSKCPGWIRPLLIIFPLAFFTFEVTHKVLYVAHVTFKLCISCDEHVFTQISARLHVAVLPVWPYFQNFEDSFSWTVCFWYLPMSHRDVIWWQLLAFHWYDKGFSLFQLLFRWFRLIKGPYKNKNRLEFRACIYDVHKEMVFSLLHKHSSWGFMLLQHPPMKRCNNVLKYPVVLGCDAMLTGKQVPVPIAGLLCTGRQQVLQALVHIYWPACHPPKTCKVHQHRCENFKLCTAHTYSYPYQINHSVVINFTEY
jgi:hypothetical protein